MTRCSLCDEVLHELPDDAAALQLVPGEGVAVAVLAGAGHQAAAPAAVAGGAGPALHPVHWGVVPSVHLAAAVSLTTPGSKRRYSDT